MSTARAPIKPRMKTMVGRACKAAIMVGYVLTSARLLSATAATASDVAAGQSATLQSSSQTPSLISTSDIRVLHRSVTISAAYEHFTNALEQILGHLPADIQQDIVNQPQVAQQRIKAAEGAQGLMIFAVFDYGAALNMVNAPRKAKQYLIGNPLTAIEMTPHDIRAALYAPLRVLVYEEASGRTIVEYDQPSSLFGQFGRDDVTQVARGLDNKLAAVIAQAAGLSR